MKYVLFIVPFLAAFSGSSHAQYDGIISSKWNSITEGDRNSPRSGVGNANGSQMIVYDYTGLSLGDCKTFFGVDRQDGAVEFVVPANRVPTRVQNQNLGVKGISKIYNAVIAVNDGYEGYPILTTVYGETDGRYWTFSLSTDSQERLDAFREIIPGLRSGVSVSFGLLSKNQSESLMHEAFSLKGSSVALRGMLEQCDN